MPSNLFLAILLLTVSIMGLLFMADEDQGQVRPQQCPPPQQQHTHTEHYVSVGVAFSFQLPTHKYETSSGKVSQNFLICKMLNRGCITTYEHKMSSFSFVQLKRGQQGRKPFTLFKLPKCCCLLFPLFKLFK